jgi:hypothetical protein
LICLDPLFNSIDSVSELAFQKEFDMGDLPQAAIDMLPLSAESMSQWKKDTDIRVFAQTLYADSRLPSFGSEMCAEFEKEMRE